MSCESPASLKYYGGIQLHCDNMKYIYLWIISEMITGLVLGKFGRIALNVYLLKACSFAGCPDCMLEAGLAAGFLDCH